MDKIDIRDLRIGNWVHCITDNVNHRIDSFGIEDRMEVHGNPWYIYDGKINILSDTEPIPLTKEILEKNGFIEKDSAYYRYFLAYEENYYAGFESISFYLESYRINALKEEVDGSQS